MELERRFCAFQIKAAGAEGEVTGYGSVFGNVDHGKDVVEHGAFAESLTQKMPLMLWSHDAWSPPIGIWEKAEEDDHGLLLTGKVFIGTSETVDQIYAGLKAKAITGLSIGYNIDRVSFDDEVRHLEKLDLAEVSFVNFPMNDRARTQVVKALQDVQNGDVPRQADFEALLRDAGLSRQQAKALCADGYNGLRTARRDNSDDGKGLAESVSKLRTIIRS